MENGEHDDMGSMSSSLSSSFLHMNPAGAPLPKMKVIISSSGNHGLTNHSGELINLNGSLNNPRKASSNPNEGITKGLTNPNGVHAINAVTQCGLSNTGLEDVRVPSLQLKAKKPVKYHECLKNHAAHIGMHATDGCGEFIPSGAEGTLEALTCAACHCHRNFHRRETEGDLASCSECRLHGSSTDRRWIDVRTYPFPAPLPLSSSAFHSAHMVKAVNMDTEDFSRRCALMSPRSPVSLKKRFRTKFTEEQKERMASFAEALGWRMQKQDEDVVEQFCAEVGVKRQVFKVWMHNNKLSVGKKLPSITMTPENAEV